MRIVSVGECMVELSGAGQGLWRQAFAGDTFNTAWYLCALMPADAQVDYLTCVGQDAISQAMVDFIAGAGIGTGCISRHPTRAPGLYMIDLKDGERSFTYWRDSSAARCLADDPDHLARCLLGADLVYFSGITLAILTPDRRRDLLAALAASGARVAFDSNMRLRLWSDADEMRDWIMKAAAVAHIALPNRSISGMPTLRAPPRAIAMPAWPRCWSRTAAATCWASTPRGAAILCPVPSVSPRSTRRARATASTAATCPRGWRAKTWSMPWRAAMRPRPRSSAGRAR